MLYLLYTSGTTAKPKGILHTTAGYLLGTSFSHEAIFDIKPDDVYWCAADIGWVTGHSYIVYGPLANATTGVMYEGAPDTPAWDRWWQIVEDYKVSILYCAPTAIRAFMKQGVELPAKHDLSTLRVLGSVGEPINPEAWMWYREHIGGDKAPVVDTWWQTETGQIMITRAARRDDDQARVGDVRRSRASASTSWTPTACPSRPVAAAISSSPGRGRPCSAASTATRSATGRPTGAASPGCTSRATAPSATLDGYLWLLGRVDDVMNVAGHRISTTEVESALVDHKSVAEAAVVGKKDEITGQAIFAFVILKADQQPSDALGGRSCASTSRPSSGRSPGRSS